MSDYLTANRAKIKAIIGLGDLVTGSIKRVFDQVGVKPAKSRWSAGATRSTPPRKCSTATSMPRSGRTRRPPAMSRLSLAAMAADGIPPGFNVITGALYEKDKAQLYDDIMSGK